MTSAYREIERLLSSLDGDDLVLHINQLRQRIHEFSPFKSEPVDFVRWVKADTVRANDYNPNSVAPPEMELLRTSISADGYTQPIVSMSNGDGTREVIDGFHRHRVGKECSEIQARIHGYLPVVEIRSSQQDKNDRMAATIRHNRARGKHKVESMSGIVVELKRRFWSDEKIGKELGMDADEVLMKRSAKRLTSRLNVAIDLHQPDKRRIDIDNRLKPLLDALQAAGVYVDDEQIDSLAVTRCKAIKGGCVRVTIEEVVGA